MKTIVHKYLSIIPIALANCFADTLPFPLIEAGNAPKIELENYTNENGENYKALSFVTVPGVIYTIERSSDLKNWTKLESYYGYGQRIIKPMVKLPQAATPSASGNPPPSLPPAPPIKIVGMNLRFATGGGIILAWTSLDDATQKIHHFANLTINPEWNNYMAYCRRIDNYFFCFGFPFISSAPQANVTHGSADTAMLESFEANFPAIKAEMEDSIQKAKLYVPISPLTDINDSGFFRVHADWSVDTDSDFSFDWMEWEQMQRIAFEYSQNGGTGLPPNGGTADPYSSDANSNGLWDTLEIDDDKDGVLDFEDAGRRAKDIDWKSQTPLRFAVFPIFADAVAAGDSLPIQVNNRGEVLIVNPENTTSQVVGQVWNKGNLTDLVSSNSTVHDARPRAIFDSGVVFGIATLKIDNQEVQLQVSTNSNSPPPSAQRLVAPAIPAPIMVGWNTSGLPIALKDADTYLLAPHPIVNDIPSSASLTSKQNQVLAYTAELVGQTNKWFQPIAEDGLQIWKVENSLSIDQISKNIEALWISVDDALATYVEPPLPPAPNSNPFINLHAKEFPFAMDHSALLPNGRLLVMQSQNPKKNLTLYTQQASMQLKDHSWGLFPSVRVSDFSANGHFATSLDSFWYDGLDWGIHQVCPGMNSTDLENLKVADTTVDGWTLLLNLNNQKKCQKALVASPVILSEDEPYTGLDEQSLRALTGESGALKEYWTMVPAGAGDTKFYIQSAACTTTPITLTGEGLTFTPATITQPKQLVSVSAAAGNTIDKAITMKIGDVQSISTPFKAKVMKPRVVKISILPTGYTAPQGTYQGVNISCGTLPTAAVIKAELDKIFQPQINVTFDVYVRPEIFRESDVATSNNFLEGDERIGPPWLYKINQINAGDKKFDLAYDVNSVPGEADSPISTRESLAVEKNRSFEEGSHLKIYILAGYDEFNIINYELENYSVNNMLPGILGIAVPHDNVCYMLAKILQDEPTQPGKFLQVMAHEIGHHFFGSGHPGNSSSPGVAGLLGSQQYKRLMYQNITSKPAPNIMRQCVKREWDKAEEWLEDNIVGN